MCHTKGVPPSSHSWGLFQLFLFKIYFNKRLKWQWKTVRKKAEEGKLWMVLVHQARDDNVRWKCPWALATVVQGGKEVEKILYARHRMWRGLPVNIVITGILKAPKNINYGFSLGEFGFETLRVLLPTDTNTNVFHFTVIFAIDCNHQGEFEVMDIKSSSHRCPVRVNTRVVHHLTTRVSKYLIDLLDKCAYAIFL